MARLELPPEVLAACRPDLSDLRIVDGEGREVPYVIDSGRDAETGIEIQKSFEPAMQEVRREKLERPETRPPLFRETFDLDVRELPETESPWELMLAAARPGFVRTLDAILLDLHGDESPLVQDASIFRLTDPERSSLRVPLPGLAAGVLRIVIEGEEGDYLEPTFRLETARSLGGGGAVRIELAEIDRSAAGGGTLFELARPRGLVPDRLALSTATGNFRRRVRVWDEGPSSGSSLLADGVLIRLAAPRPVEELELAVSAASGDRLRVMVDDGDSPALEEVVWSAVMRRPALIFSTDGPPEDLQATLLFGGGRAHRPRYDLAALLPALTRRVTGQQAEIGERLYDPALLATARLGEMVDNPVFDPSPALAFAMRAGGEIDERLYSHRQAIDAAPSREGLVRFGLALETLAQAAPELEDLRIVDEDSRQRPYLVEDRADEVTRPLAISGPATKDRESRYAIDLPASAVIFSELVLHSEIPFFDRGARLIATLDGEEGEIAAFRLVRQSGQSGPLRIRIPQIRIERLELVVEDGDDAPLTFSAAEGRFPVPAVYFAAPAGRYSVLVGYPEATAPRYEIEGVRNVVLTAAAGAGGLSELTENPRFSLGSRLGSKGGAEQIALWAALALAVGVLTFLTLRLARSEPG